MADNTKNVNVLIFSSWTRSLVMMRLMEVRRPAAPVEVRDGRGWRVSWYSLQRVASTAYLVHVMTQMNVTVFDIMIQISLYNDASLQWIFHEAVYVFANLYSYFIRIFCVCKSVFPNDDQEDFDQCMFVFTMAFHCCVTHFCLPSQLFWCLQLEVVAKYDIMYCH